MTGFARAQAGVPPWRLTWEIKTVNSKGLDLRLRLPPGFDAIEQDARARLSARLGEGVLNGLLTARVGLSAMAVCRPMAYAARKPPGVSEIAPFLFKREA